MTPPTITIPIDDIHKVLIEEWEKVYGKFNEESDEQKDKFYFMRGFVISALKNYVK